MKKIVFLIGLLMLGVVNVNALTGAFNCTPDTGIINDAITCQVTITPQEEELITSFRTNIDFPSADFELVSIIPATNWVSSSTTSIDLTNPTYEEEQGLTEQLMIATLNFKIKSTTTYDVKTISLNGTDLSSVINDTVHIKSTNNLLSSLTVVGKDFSFNPNTKTYNISNYTGSTATVRATLADSRAHFDNTHKPKIYELNYGNNAIQIVVISENGTSNVYTININRVDDRSNNNNLSTLGISVGTLNPSFSKNNLVYDVAVPASIENVTISASLENNKATFVNGYGPRAVKLQTGANSVLIQVKAENGEIKTYTVNITRSDKKSNNYLKSVKLTNGKIDFKKETLEYKLNVEYETAEMEITAVAEDSSAKVQVIGNKDLKVGENNFEIKVTAENESVRSYKLVVTRLEEGIVLSTNNYLKELVIKGYNIFFDKDVLEYNIKIKDDNKLTMSYIPEDETATVKVVGNSDLKSGSKINIVVTAENGDIKTYTLNIEKQFPWMIIGIIFGGILLVGGIVAGIVFKDKIFKPKERVIESDVLKDAKLVLGSSPKVEKKEPKKVEPVKKEIPKAVVVEETKVNEKKPELTVIPEIPEEEFDESLLYLEDDKK